MTDVTVDENQITVVEVEAGGITVVEVTIPGAQGPAGGGDFDIAIITDAAYGAVGDGITDDTVSIQAALSSGKAWVYVPDGTFLHQGVTFPSTVQRFFGPGTLKALLPGNASGCQLRVSSYSGSGLEISDIIVDMPTSSFTTQSAIRVLNSTKVKIKNVFVKGGGRNGIYITGSTDCGAEDCLVEDFYLYGILGSDIDAAPNTRFYARRNRVRATTITNNPRPITVGGAATVNIDSDIDSNRVDCNGSTNFGIYAGAGEVRLKVKRNNIRNNIWEGITTVSNGAVIDSNDIDVADATSVDFGCNFGGNDISITRNRVKGHGKAGMAILQGTGGVIAFNEIINPCTAGTDSYGLRVYNAGGSGTNTGRLVFSNVIKSANANMQYGFGELVGGTVNSNLFADNSVQGSTVAEYVILGAASKVLRHTPSGGGTIFDGGVVCGAAALGTTATSGFLYIPTCAGTPTGVPVAKTGMVAMVFDTTNNKLYIYDGGWLGGTTPGAFV